MNLEDKSCYSILSMPIQSSQESLTMDLSFYTYSNFSFQMILYIKIKSNKIRYKELMCTNLNYFN